MRLKSLEYSEQMGKPEQWSLQGLSLGEINLLVGKNASGKSRILNVIHNLARAISRQHNLTSGNFLLIFDNHGTPLQYELKILEAKIVQEVFTIGDHLRLERGAGGKGKIFADKLKDFIEFQTPDNQLAAVARRDSIQHSFFEPLHQWAESLYYYAFGTTLGKDNFAVFIQSDEQKSEVDPKDSKQVVPIYRKGQHDFGSTFTDAVKEDFTAIGYPIDEVGIAPPRAIRVQGNLPGEFAGMYVKESNLPGITDQYTMSQGMFRALSIIVQVNYSVLADTPSCILIDDIGEGLDFERSCALIDCLMFKAQSSSVQLLMSTNDRFVMNRVPLEAWSVLDRQGNQVEIHNYSNSKEVFDNFKFTGLNNFDFLAFDYLKAGSTDE